MANGGPRLQASLEASANGSSGSGRRPVSDQVGGHLRGLADPAHDLGIKDRGDDAQALGDRIGAIDEALELRREGHRKELFAAAGVGPAANYTASLDADRQAQLRELCPERLRDEPSTVTAGAWAARGLA